jgi:piezo-type mechanosensitive ion channel component 1/2
LLWILYFCIAGYQVAVGLPELRKGSFMVGQYDIVSCYTFRSYMAIPFIFELKTIIDWTFTKTALDVF